MKDESIVDENNNNIYHSDVASTDIELNRQAIDIVSKLNQDNRNEILKFLNITELYRYSAVSKVWRKNNTDFLIKELEEWFRELNTVMEIKPENRISKYREIQKKIGEITVNAKRFAERDRELTLEFFSLQGNPRYDELKKLPINPKPFFLGLAFSSNDLESMHAFFKNKTINVNMLRTFFLNYGACTTIFACCKNASDAWIQSKWINMIKLLLEHGADVTIANERGTTLYDYTKNNNSASIKALILIGYTEKHLSEGKTEEAFSFLKESFSYDKSMMDEYLTRINGTKRGFNFKYTTELLLKVEKTFNEAQSSQKSCVLS